MWCILSLCFAVDGGIVLSEQLEQLKLTLRAFMSSLLACLFAAQWCEAKFPRCNVKRERHTLVPASDAREDPKSIARGNQALAIRTNAEESQFQWHIRLACLVSCCPAPTLHVIVISIWWMCVMLLQRFVLVMICADLLFTCCSRSSRLRINCMLRCCTIRQSQNMHDSRQQLVPSILRSLS